MAMDSFSPTVHTMLQLRQRALHQFYSPLDALWNKVSAQSVRTLNASCIVMLTAFSGRERVLREFTHSLSRGQKGRVNESLYGTIHKKVQGN